MTGCGPSTNAVTLLGSAAKSTAAIVRCVMAGPTATAKVRRQAVARRPPLLLGRRQRGGIGRRAQGVDGGGEIGGGRGERFVAAG